MKVSILGIDGYIGWPLALDLLRKGYKVTGLDNFSRRKRVYDTGSDSLTPIRSWLERKRYLRQTFPNFVNERAEFDLHSHYSFIDSYLKHLKPDAIIHLAEQPSAPWSMISPVHAAATQNDNVIGTLNLLWAMRKRCPDAHLIKLGTMGEYGCYDDKTEILTKGGWKLFSNLRGTEEVAVRTKNDRHLKFKVPNSVHEYDFDGEMYSLQNNRLDMVVTPNHRMFTVKRSGSDYYGLREEIAEDIISKSRVYDIGLEWKGEDREYFDILGSIMPTSIWIKFLGWFLSEGSVSIRNDRPNPYHVRIKQKNTQSHETRICMQDVADILNLQFHEYKEGDIDIFVLSGKDFANYMLNRFGRSADKFIPQDIKQLSQKYLNILLGYLLAGDGYRHHRGFRYSSISKRLADDVQEISLKCGWAATISSRFISSGRVMYTVGISKSTYSHVNHSKNKFNDSWIPYKGKVYCVNVGDDGIIFVRRNGKPYWSGNTPNCDIPEGEIPETCISGCIGTINENLQLKEFQCPLQGLPFPRSPGSLYHLSKVHDTHNIIFACKTWGLKSTDIMQGVVYGITDTEEKLLTRFDYDEYFGTAINRFVAQALIGHPLTVYGNGTQSRGFLPLKDSIQCLNIALENPPKKAEYRVFNQFENIYTIIELAKMVRDNARNRGFNVTIDNIKNPRTEMDKHYYNPTHQKLFDLGYKPTTDTFEEIGLLLNTMLKYQDRVIPEVIMPKTTWR